MITTSASHPWINRQAADELFEEICSKPSGVTIYLIKAPAGVGKTYLARDIGVRLGSLSGYEHGHKQDIYWSGIIDLYDPDTSSEHIERRWIDAFGNVTGFEFEEYTNKRNLYNNSASRAATVSESERQVHEVRTAFAEGMEKSTVDRYPVMAFDTIERLQTIFDPAQEKLDIQAIERPDILVWLLHQLTLLSHGVILMVGRSAPTLMAELEREVEKINPQRRARGLQSITLKISSLAYLTENEQEVFFQHRIAQNPRLNRLLDARMKSLLGTHTNGNPLLLDIAIQTLLVETGNPVDVEKALLSPKGIQAVEEALLMAYMNSGASEQRRVLLIYLAIARNGLFEELLNHLDEVHFSELQHELNKMRDLPFIKVREILVYDLAQEQRKSQLTYFLHDEMYEICDRVGLIGLKQLQKDSKKIADWYDSRIKQYPNASKQLLDEITDLLIESLPYRMRSDPQKAYRWFLEQSDQAIRSAERDLDLRLQSAMAQFISSATDLEPGGELPRNAIDREILKVNAPQLQSDFEIDSTLLWLKRYSTRSQHEQALEIARKATWVEAAYKTDSNRYLITYAEFLLWQGQSAMYSGKSDAAMRVYTKALAMLHSRFPFEQRESQVKSKETLTADDLRICHVFGRLYNNLGYIHWYQGKYWIAVDEFKDALRYFQLANLLEEIANSEDNMGRVYAILGYNYQASEHISDGLKLRIAAGSQFREALSRNSLAILYFRYNNAARALTEVEAALRIFERFEVERGIALAHFTRGVAYRHLARDVEPWQDPTRAKEQALGHIEEAEVDLRRALRIFSEKVQEPIRKIQVHNELASVYRARYLLLRNTNDPRQHESLQRSRSHFDLAIELADKGGFPIAELDSLQDRAVLYVSAGYLDLARVDIDAICRKIPEEYQIKKGRGLVSLGDGVQCVDGYYLFMGKTEELKADIDYDETKNSKAEIDQISARELAGEIDHEQAQRAIKDAEAKLQMKMLSMLEHFTLACAYFNAFSIEGFQQQHTHRHIYTKLRGSSDEFILNVREKYLPAWLEEYSLPAEPIRSQFDGIFNVLLPENKKQGPFYRR